MPEFHELFPGASRNTAHYLGDVAADVMSNPRPFGPDTCGARYTAVSASYDPETGRTTVQFRPIPPKTEGHNNAQRPKAQRPPGPNRSVRRRAARRNRSRH